MEHCIMSLWTTMLQIALSFLAGVYVGTEYECRPYVEEVKKALSKLEKKSAPKDSVPKETQTPVTRSWLSWGGGESEKDKKN